MTGSLFGLVESSRLGGRDYGARVIAGGRALYIAATSAAELDSFLRALSIGARTTTFSSADQPLAIASSSQQGHKNDESSYSAGNISPIGTWSGTICGGSTYFGALRESAFNARAGSMATSLMLPSAVDIDGPPEVGSELRVRGANLDNLCVAWFRCRHDLPEPDVSRDVAVDANIRFIPGATQQTYTVVSSDVGFKLGCSVRPAAGGGGRWSLLSAAITAVDVTIPSVRLQLRPHIHTKYCDRRVRVCTAIGRYREGEILELKPRGPASTAAGGISGSYTVAWYRSAGLVSPDGGAGPAASIHGDENLSGLPFRRVIARSVSDLPPSPPDAAPAPSIDEIKSSLARMPPSHEPAGGARVYPIFSSDEGTMLVAVLLPVSAAPPEEVFPYAQTSEPGLVMSLPIGPIEPAPPRAREIWIEGEARVGALLIGNTYYYGGREKLCVCSWVCIGDDGDIREVKAPVESPPVSTAPLPALNSPIGGIGDSHPRALRVSKELLGCLIKFRVQPVRADGDEGHLESSRPTKEVTL